MKLDLSIIIVSYNTKKYLRDCLNSLYSNTRGVKFEVIVVDNHSTDGSQQMLAKHFPKVKLIKSQQNLGFGRANNLGAKQAKGKYLLFLNPDTLISPDSIKESIKLADQTSKLGALTIRLLFADSTIQPTGGYFPTLFRLLAWHTALDELPVLKHLIGPIHPPASFYTHSFEPDWITGAFMLIPSPVFNKVSGFDEHIFMYGEDLELCYRLKQLGYKVIYSNSPSITHLQSKASSSQFALISEITGIKYFYKKHKPSWQLPLVNIIFKLGSLLRLLLFGIILGDDAKKQAYHQALKL